MCRCTCVCVCVRVGVVSVLLLERKGMCLHGVFVLPVCASVLLLVCLFFLSFFLVCVCVSIPQRGIALISPNQIDASKNWGPLL